MGASWIKKSKLRNSKIYFNKTMNWNSLITYIKYAILFEIAKKTKIVLLHSSFVLLHLSFVDLIQLYMTLNMTLWFRHSRNKYRNIKKEDNGNEEWYCFSLLLNHNFLKYFWETGFILELNVPIEQHCHGCIISC